jgi:hypothetical protein
MTFQQIQQQKINSEIELVLDFIFSHFEEPLFPRKISTYKSENKQFLIRSKQEIIDSFIDSDSIDCKINAYPYFTEYKGIPRYRPNFIFIDIDRNNFETDRRFKLALSTTLKNIKEKLGNDCSPSILFTGGGYHIYQPVYCPTALENVIEFTQFDRPSELFLRFAKDSLSNNKADKSNNPSFRSCLLRIPGSINSKYISKVKIVQKWNGYRSPITREFAEDFRTYLIQKKIDVYNKRQKVLLKIKNQNKNRNTNWNYYYDWIDKNILANPFEDFRKIIVDLILAPYLINVKKLSYEKSYQIIKEWLDKCNSLERLDNYQNFVNYRINYALKKAIRKGIGPMSQEKIKTENKYRNLYILLKKKGFIK